jgi:glycosyltransferase involved in cell wall biosynthesis
LGLLHLIGFEEPFGLSVVEAMACGTPVLAYPRGSMPELIAPGTSGYLVQDEAEALAAVAHLRGLDRKAVRAHAERFSAARMVEAYLQAYRTILEGAGSL